MVWKFNKAENENYLIIIWYLSSHNKLYIILCIKLFPLCKLIKKLKEGEKIERIFLFLIKDWEFGDF